MTSMTPAVPLESAIAPAIALSAAASTAGRSIAEWCFQVAYAGVTAGVATGIVAAVGWGTLAAFG